MTHLLRKPAMVMLAMLFAVAGSLATGPRVRDWADDWFARRLASRAEAAPDDQVRRILEPLVDVGDAGLSQLVRGLHSDRPATCNGSRDILAAQVEVWRGWHVDDSLPRVAKLADLLLVHLEPEHREATWRSAEFANQLLAWPTTTAQDNVGTRMIYSCEQVLRAARRIGWPPPVSSDEFAPGNLNVADNSTEPFVATNQGITEAENAVLGQVETASSAPATVGPLPEITPLVSAPPADRISAPPSPESVTSSAAIEPPRELPPSITAWATLSNLEVIRALARADQSPAAEEELRARGFDDKHLRLARLATNADPEARLQLVPVLPQLSGINATAWLLLLARDEAPRVRAAAVQLLSTSKDDNVQRQLRELEQQEVDDDVRSALLDAVQRR